MVAEGQPQKPPALLRAAVVLLWLPPLAVPLAGGVYAFGKLKSGEAFGPISISIVVASLAWLLLQTALLVVPSIRGQLFSRRGVARLLGGYLACLILLGLSELLLLVLDVGLGIQAARPLALSLWSFADDAPPLAGHFVTDGEHGSHFADTDEPNYNAQGFRDRDSFTQADPSTQSRLRVLVIGDSFAYGSSAISDGSNTGFCDVLEQALQQATTDGATVWNTGIPGTGQVEQLLHLQRFRPVLKPQVVLLSLYEGNDLVDNVTPVGNCFVFAGDVWVNRYDHERDLLLGPRLSWLRSQGYGVSSQSAWLKLRVPSLALRLWRTARRRLDEQGRATEFEQQLAATRDAVSQITQYCHDAEVRCVVLAVPTLETIRDGTGATGSIYARLLQMLRELHVPTIEMHEIVAVADYVPPPDGHWNKSGHRKAAQQVLQWITQADVQRD